MFNQGWNGTLQEGRAPGTGLGIPALEPKAKIGRFHSFCFFENKIITQYGIFKCKVSFFFFYRKLLAFKKLQLLYIIVCGEFVNRI